MINRIVVLIAILVAGTAQAQTTQPVGYKDPGTATIISVLIPGGGQMYSGETQRGLTLLGIGVGGLVVGTALSANSVGCDTDSCDADANFLPLALGYLAYLGAWAYGIMDADESAQRMNAKLGVSIGGAQVAPVVAAGAGGGAQVGLTVRF